MRTATAVDDVTWDLEPLLAGEDVEALLARADALADTVAEARGTVSAMSPAALGELMDCLSTVRELLGRALSFASLGHATDVTDPARGALLQKVQERATAVDTKLVFFDLEWAALPDDCVGPLLEAPELERYRHHLDAARRYRNHLLSEPEERLLREKDVTGRSAWTRLFGQLVSTIEVPLDGRTATLEEALSRLQSPDREMRRTAAEAITEGLRPGLSTRAYVFNTLLADKALDDRLRRYPTWITSRNLANEATDESVGALVDSVRRRFDIPQRWYALKARVLGVERIADYDRMASLASDDVEIPFDDARTVVLDAYGSFSPELADICRRFFDERWIDAAPRAGKRPGAFCAYTVPSHHPYVFLNYTARRGDVMTMAHELGHGVHGYLARVQSPFSQMTPLTLAETASVFGETVTFNALLGMEDDPAGRLALLAENIERAIATIFRQTAMNRFEALVHTARREEGELSVDRFGELWAESQREMLGDAVEVTEGYRSWWSYIPHFISTPGYVYAYAYGQLLALSVYRQYEEQGSDFVPRYLHLLSAGGSMAPEELGRIVGCDLADPHFWDGGLEIVEQQLEAAEAAAFEAGRIRD